MKFKGVIFDLDGTLINSLKDIADSMNDVLKNHNLPIHETDDYRYFIGEGIENLIIRALPEQERTVDNVKSYLTEYRILYKEHCLDNTEPYPGIEKMLSILWDKGIPTAVLSNKSDRFTRFMVNTIFPENKFITVRGAFEEIAVKPDPTGALIISKNMQLKNNNIIFVGDSAVDIETGKNAGMTSFGVTWGIRPESELIAAGASLLIHKPEQLLEYF